MTALQQLGGYIASGVRQSLTPELREALKLHVIDTVGAWVATAATHEARALTKFRNEVRKASPGDLALEVMINCALPRLSEIDDIHFASMITPGAIVVPSALTMAAALPGQSADTLAEAIVAGYETMIRFGTAIDGANILYRGIWPSYFAAPLGVAAAAARLRELNAEQAAQALALALNLTSPGVGHHSTATTSRWLAIGASARNGLLAARAAQAGFTSDLAMLDGKFLSNVYAITPDLAAFTLGLGGRPKLMDVSFKPWCAARQTMAATQAFVELLAEGVAVADIDEITVAIPPVQQKMIDHGVKAGERLTYLTSLPYMLATAAVAPDTRFDIRPTSQTAPEIPALMAKVKIRPDDSLMREYPAAWPAWVALRTATGTRERLVRLVPGDPARPLDDTQLLDKLRRVVAIATSPATAAAVVSAGRALLEADDLTSAAAAALRAGGIAL